MLFSSDDPSESRLIYFYCTDFILALVDYQKGLFRIKKSFRAEKCFFPHIADISLIFAHLSFDFNLSIVGSWSNFRKNILHVFQLTKNWELLLGLFKLCFCSIRGCDHRRNRTTKNPTLLSRRTFRCILATWTNLEGEIVWPRDQYVSSPSETYQFLCKNWILDQFYHFLFHHFFVTSSCILFLTHFLQNHWTVQRSEFIRLKRSEFIRLKKSEFSRLKKSEFIRLKKSKFIQLKKSEFSPRIILKQDFIKWRSSHPASNSFKCIICNIIT